MKGNHGKSKFSPGWSAPDSSAGYRGRPSYWFCPTCKWTSTEEKDVWEHIALTEAWLPPHLRSQAAPWYESLDELHPGNA